jgi:hypothetical protein
MQRPVNITEIFSPSHSGDLSICLEAHGFLNQSYDSMDSLLRELAHSASVTPDHAGAPVELTVTGQPEWLMPFSHLFL